MLSAIDPPGYVPDRHSNNAPQARHPDVGDTRNVVQGRRKRRSPPRADGMATFLTRTYHWRESKPYRDHPAAYRATH